MMLFNLSQLFSCYSTVKGFNLVDRISNFKLFFLILLLIVDQFTVHSADEDYYQLLGITKSADNREIRKAFKKLALIHHPDKNKVKRKFFHSILTLNYSYYS